MLYVRDDRETPLLRDGMRGKMLLIWGRDQRRRAAADWHDGQIGQFIPHGEERIFARLEP